MREMTILTLAVFHSERATLAQHLPRAALMRTKRLLLRAPCRLTGEERVNLEQVMAYSASLHEMHLARQTKRKYGSDPLRRKSSYCPA